MVWQSEKNMNPLEILIAKEIEELGPMTVATFMERALSHPQYGYYMTRDPFGKKGDFTTAPEISQLFGEMVGLWCVDTWLRMGSPRRFSLVEAGPGRGTLMADIMRATRHVEGFHDSCSVHLLEVSPVLKAQQEEKLQNYQVSWHSDVDSIPEECPIIFVANEFFDALPVRQIENKNGQPMEVFVGVNDNQFCFRSYPLDAHQKKFSQEGFIEWAPDREVFLKTVADRVVVQGGAGLIIDYGYQEGSGNTLQALKDHTYKDVLQEVGECDITAHVDFAALGSCLVGKNITVYGPINQRAFLKNMGLDLRLKHLLGCANDKQKQDLVRGAERLTNITDMGSLFKVLGFSHSDYTKMAGFYGSA